ncbi:MAG TPA: hypothetical protein VF945_02430 [Polyangia bacterium]
MSVVADMTASSGDMTMVTPFNMPGFVFCYSGPLCSTTSATPICCDIKNPDGGFNNSCVATAGACTAIDPQAKTFACGQAADCGAGMVCCGDIGTSNSGKKFFNSTTCAASCGSTLKQLCVTKAECTATGVSCVGQTITGRNVGICQ